MRDIKFRMYDKKTKIMSPVHLMEWGKIENNLFYYRGYYDCDKSDWSVVACNDVNKQTSVKREGNDVLIKRYELMQFTGLHDKNGKEIYEGDIIRIFNDEDDYWDDEVSFHLSAFFSGDEDLLVNVHFRSEVIGNIYEHPHLLEGVK